MSKTMIVGLQSPTVAHRGEFIGGTFAPLAIRGTSTRSHIDRVCPCSMQLPHRLTTGTFEEKVLDVVATRGRAWTFTPSLKMA